MHTYVLFTAIFLSYQAKPTELKNTHGDSVKTPTYVDVELICKKWKMMMG